jgi:hypothetical protein
MKEAKSSPSLFSLSAIGLSGKRNAKTLRAAALPLPPAR